VCAFISAHPNNSPSLPFPTTCNLQAILDDRVVMKRITDCRRLFTTKWKREQKQRGTVKKSVQPSFKAITMLAAALE
jgi:hypothetical protein|tara:strand:- start:278 stop:508 length:231 start_codon:yes stop_codon:yes gene_type:complete